MVDLICLFFFLDFLFVHPQIYWILFQLHFFFNFANFADLKLNNGYVHIHMFRVSF